MLSASFKEYEREVTARSLPAYVIITSYTVFSKGNNSQKNMDSIGKNECQGSCAL
jgi:hypothetical protein